MELAKAAGAKRAMRLNVSGAFHSPLMAVARDGLAAAIDWAEFRDPAFPVYAGHADDTAPGSPTIVNVERLDYYFGKLALTDLGVPGAITRAGHWGDSVIGGDGLTEAIRRKLQQRFGDGDVGRGLGIGRIGGDAETRQGDQARRR